MGEKLDRRQALKVIAGASLSAVRPLSAEAKTRKAEFLPSPLDQETLEGHKMRAVDTLIGGFWEYPRVRNYINRHYFGDSRERPEVRRKLHDESRMFIPTPQKCEDVRNRNAAHLNKLAHEMSDGKYGIFVDGDEQMLYLLQHLGQNRVQFVKGYPISTSREAWSNAPNSGGTPIGLHHIAEERKGMLGEIVAASKPNGRDYVHMHVDVEGRMETKTFVKSLVHGGDAAAELITDRLLLVGPATPPPRGINIHGTNRTDLLGTRGTGGCIRQSNVDITDLSQYIEVGSLVREGGTEVRGGTPVMIQATWKMSTDKKRHRKENRDHVPYRKRRNLFEEID